MLLVSVSQLLKESIGSTRDCEVDDVVDIAGGDARVTGTVTLTLIDRGLLAQGKLRAQTELTCGRCLSPFVCGLELDIEGEYYPETDALSGATLPVPDVSGAFTIDKHHILNLTDAIRQYVTMVTPMKPLCRRSCAGLCPHCGADLNLERCDCPAGSADKRLSALSKLAASGGSENT